MIVKGKNVLVAGGSMGIGKASAILLAEEGARVFVVDINDAEGENTVKQIQEGGGQASFFHTDVTNADQVEELIDQISSQYKRIDVLYSSVAVYTRNKVEYISESEWDRMMRINVKSAFLLCKYILPIMKEQGGGSIILTSSSVGYHDSAPNIAAYATTKFAITGFTKSAACDYLTDNIRVNCICPGPTDTPMIRGGRSPEELQDFIDGIPIGRLADPYEIAQAVLFLASDRSSFITGVSLPVDGGQTAWV